MPSLPNEASTMRLFGAVLFEQDDEWRTSSRDMTVGASARTGNEEIDPISAYSHQQMAAFILPS